MALPNPIPDDPTKWEGWQAYLSDDPYERLCLDLTSKLDSHEVEDHCRRLLVWWQKKLPLRNQPANPISQLLRGGFDEAPRRLSQARAELLDPAKREAADMRRKQRGIASARSRVHDLLGFAAQDGIVPPGIRGRLLAAAAAFGLNDAEAETVVVGEMEALGLSDALPPPTRESPGAFDVTARSSPPLDGGDDAELELIRLMELSGVGVEEMSEDKFQTFIGMAGNMGIDARRADQVIHDFFEGSTERTAKVQVAKPPETPVVVSKPVPRPSPQVWTPDLSLAQETDRFPEFTNSLGMPMLLVPSGTFTMGSVVAGAAPNEQPLTKVLIKRFFIARFPVTTSEYAKFDKNQASRSPGVGEDHPAVFVSSNDASRFCQWLSAKEGKSYRLPTEAEWEYAARGTGGRIYPWGDETGAADLANFADKNTRFAWSDPYIDDGYRFTSPVGSYPRGASPFGVEDMAGNVWEWCSDQFGAYPGGEVTNPHGPRSGTNRVYRGGSWRSRFNGLRATVRGFNLPGFTSNDVGFRVVCECDTTGIGIENPASRRDASAPIDPAQMP